MSAEVARIYQRAAITIPACNIVQVQHAAPFHLNLVVSDSMIFSGKHFISATCLSLFVISFAATVFAADTLTINTTGTPPLNTPDQNGFVDRVVSEAFQRVGLKLHTVKLPAERGLKNANDGTDDGDMVRIKGLERLYPNLVMVPEKIMQWEFNAFSQQKPDLQGQWSNLLPYSVSYIIGWKILEKNVPQGVEVTTVKNQQQLFSLLEKRRTDLVIYERWGGLKYLQDKGVTDVELITPPLAVRDMYIYLNKKHEKHVSGLAAALRDMKGDGMYQHIYEQTLAPLIKKNN